jgi:sugar O-acyltransferase (sialic acid O-acetyltransferase NeuD family)
LIFGAGGHARVIATLLGGTVDLVDRHDEEKTFAAGVSDRRAYVAIGDNRIRERVFSRLVAAGAKLPPLIAPLAYVAPNAIIGDGTIVLPGAAIMPGAAIGRNCIVEMQASIDHDSIVGDHTFIGPGVTIPGEVRIGARCMIGLKASTFPRVSIGDRVTVRAASLVTKDVIEGAKVGGTPAQVLA